MRVALISVGRLKAGPEREIFERYRQRFAQTGRGIGLDPFVETEISESSRGSSGERRKEEASLVLKKLPKNSKLIVLDEKGAALNSEKFAARLSRFRDDGIQALAFAIGGPDGHGREAIDAAEMRLSLGPMTLPHGLARIVLMEQLYRAATILAGHPYHRG